MSFIENLINVVLHIDKYLNIIIQNYGLWTYGIIFLIIFCETGLVITPFLPGDSIIFATGALASEGMLEVFTLYIVFFLAAVLGDTANYFIGKKIGTGILEKENIRFVNKEHLDKAHRFYEKHGSMAIVLGRFIPIIRTFVPFIAGIGEMSYSKFITYNVLGGFLWVSLFLWGGYFFGSLPFIKRNFSYVVIAIIIISLIPAVVTFVRERKKDDTADAEI
ncbi:DedA family protein [Clostridium luticellarii]|jgi:membrane-associated protein|uniref:DedA family protein n=1 Tax=Clostridium luticellarii TaxID=1691940 RepID=UPI002357AA26|nr:DedA family protein [Clostridium luticellarii]MCI1944004.1 DedA family protein [Clostridium luticellarii]MCI1967354.1 DedA family protein [Clostridium luticellarii]MCI1995545.1 DedA family protein [Clostridium luticellarii]MCI2039160.1 DedA family protein [Clostridium luticellarii]